MLPTKKTTTLYSDYRTFSLSFPFFVLAFLARAPYLYNDLREIFIRPTHNALRNDIKIINTQETYINIAHTSIHPICLRVCTPTCYYTYRNKQEYFLVFFFFSFFLFRSCSLSRSLSSLFLSFCFFPILIYAGAAYWSQIT